jgi:hypothetical protein
MPGMRGPITETEIEKFLESRLNIQLATIDENGYSNIQPTWFYYDRDSEKLMSQPKRRQGRFRT